MNMNSPKKENKLIRIWKKKGKILEGIKNSIFKKEDIEVIAQERMIACNNCPYIGRRDEDCEFGFGPCCTICGCVLGYKLRVMSESCPHPDGPLWSAELSEEESEELNKKISLDNSDKKE